MPDATTPPAGWYPDPQEPSQVRYWDGASWTEHSHADPTAVAAPPATAQPTGTHARLKLVAGVIVVLGVAAAAWALLIRDSSTPSTFTAPTEARGAIEVVKTDDADTTDDTDSGDTDDPDTSDDTDSAATSSTTTTTTTTTLPPAEPGTEISEIGRGVDVTVARANWSSGYIQAEIYHQILTRMGYNVRSPSLLELGPSAAYLAMAEGDFDFWTNSWYPLHDQWLAGALPDGTLVGDYVSIVGGLFQGSAIHGFLINKSVADDYGITSIQQINDSPDLVALFDTDGNGKAEIFGCEEFWTCDGTINSMIAFYGWDNVEQIVAGYDAMFAEMTGRVAAGDPGIIYTWTPSNYVVALVPGDTVMWLSTHPTDVLDGSNPAGIEGGEFHTQEAGFSALGPATCTQPCQLGWKPYDITVTANNQFLAANPVLAALFPLIRPAVIDYSILQVEQSSGDGSEDEVVRLASQWVDANWGLITDWINQAARDAR